eukprot:TRINITY_DN46356_c0_g1_i1.p1 TRINITY_DN46356_c0_g1~~TRINITY_DN46356_c0_g1_i1.p1  ORF type:complete len:265 (+),score=20.60 TRINITY_DN46356_c0_g1_i1:117-911(+)
MTSCSFLHDVPDGFAAGVDVLNKLPTDISKKLITHCVRAVLRKRPPPTVAEYIDRLDAFGLSPRLSSAQVQCAINFFSFIVRSALSCQPSPTFQEFGRRIRKLCRAVSPDALEAIALQWDAERAGVDAALASPDAPLSTGAGLQLLSVRWRVTVTSAGRLAPRAAASAATPADAGRGTVSDEDAHAAASSLAVRAESAAASGGMPVPSGVVVVLVLVVRDWDGTTREIPLELPSAHFSAFVKRLQPCAEALAQAAPTPGTLAVE